MRTYFPIPPNISLSELKEKVTGSITFLNCPNNRLKRNIFKKNYHSVYLGIYLFRNEKWNLLKIYECKPFCFIEIKRNQLNVEDHEMVVAVVKKKQSFVLNSSKLPEPDSLKRDSSVVAQRASLNFSYLEYSSSYQGEYPFSMYIAKRGSLFTFDTLKNTGAFNQKNFLIFMNLSGPSYSSRDEKIKIFDPNKKDKFKLIDARRNAFTIFPTETYEKELGCKETYFFTSKECSFIPIMLSINCENNLLSVEHTHPPTEYFFAPEKKNLVNLIRKVWS